MRKFAMDLIAGKLLTKSNNKIANLGLGYLQNLLWTILVADLAAKLPVNLGIENKLANLATKIICGFSCKSHL